MHTAHRSVIGGAIALMAGLVYLNALHNPFVYDDYHTVSANPSIASLNLRAIVLHDVTRPLVNFSYALDRAVWGARPFGFHVTSVLLHMANAALLFHLAWRLSSSVTAAGAAAALFAVHPMMTEAVGYISGRSEVLCALFLLLAFLCGREWLNGGGARWGTLTIASWVAALMSKETAAMFPFAFALHDMLTPHVGRVLLDPAHGGDVGGSQRPRPAWSIHLPLIGFTVLAGIVRLAVLWREYPGRVAIHWEYLAVDVDVLARYLVLMVRPAGQTIFHAVPLVGLFDPRGLASLALVAACVAVAWRLRRTAWIAAFGIAWFFLFLVPSSVFILLDQGEPMTEHRVYVASLGLLLAAGAGIDALAGWVRAFRPALRPAGAIAFVLVILSLGVSTAARNAVWSDPVALWRESVDRAPGHYRPRLLLGEALEDAGLGADGMEQYRIAIRLQPNDPTGYVKLGRSFAAIGRFAEARQQFQKALDVDPRDVGARESMRALDTLETRLGIRDGGR